MRQGYRISQPIFIKCLNNVMGKVKRSLSILLAIAMIITMMPQTAMPVYAGEISANGDESETPKTDDPGTPSVPETGTPGGEISDESGTPSENEDGTLPEGDIPENNDENNNNGDGAVTDPDDVIPADPASPDNNTNTISGTDDDNPIDVPMLTTLEDTVTVTFAEVSNQKGTGFTVAAEGSDGAPATNWTIADGDYKFRVKLDDDYKSFEASASDGSHSANITQGTLDNGYYLCTLAADAVSGFDGDAITITITAVKKEPVTLNIATPDQSIGSVWWASEKEDDGTIKDENWKKIDTGKLDDQVEGNEIYVKFEFADGVDKNDYKVEFSADVADLLTGPDAEHGGYYTVTLNKDVRLTVKATRIQYSLNIEADEKAEVTWGSENSTDITGKVAANTNGTAANADLSFKVAVKESYKEYKVTKVVYKIGGEDAAEQTPTLNKGVYTVPKSKITDNVTIIVETGIDESNAYNLTWALPQGVANTKAYSVKLYATKGGELKDGIEDEDMPYYPTNGNKITTVTDTFYAIITPGKNYEIPSEITNDFFTANPDDEATVDVKEVNDTSNMVDPPSEVPEGAKLLRIEYKKAANLTLTINVKAKTLGAERTILIANKSSNLTYAVTTGNGISKKGVTNNSFVAADDATELIFTVTANKGFGPVVMYEPADESELGSEGAEFNGLPTTDKKTGKMTYTYVIAIADLKDNAVITLTDTPALQMIKVKYDDTAVKITKVRIDAKALDMENPGESVRDFVGDDQFTKIGTVFEVDHGATITITLEALAHCQIASVTQNDGVKDKKLLTKAAQSYDVVIKADGTSHYDITVNVDANELYWAVLKDTTDSESPKPIVEDWANGGSVEVDSDHTYELQVFHGNVTDTAASEAASAFVEITEELKNGSGAKIATLAEESKDKVTLDFKADEKASGNNLIVKLYKTQQEVKDKKPAVTYTFKVYKKLVGKDIGVYIGKTKVPKIDQTADTTKTYELKWTPGANGSNLEAKFAEADAKRGFDASIKGNVLTVTTPQEIINNDSVKLYIYNGNAPEDAEVGQSSDTAAICTIPVNSIQQLDQTKTKPTMKLAASDDVSLTLSLTAPMTVEQTINKKVYYEVTIKSKGAVAETKTVLGTSKTEDNGTKADVAAVLTGSGTSKVFFVPLAVDEDGNTILTKEQKIKVNKQEFGQGDAWSYTVQTRLIQANKEASLGDAVGDSNGMLSADTAAINDNLLAWSNYTAEATYNTKRPYYEDKLKLTKKNTTIYTGQVGVGATQDDPSTPDVDESKGVLIATAVFGANTTYRTLDYAEETEYGTSSKTIGDQTDRKGSLELIVDKENGLVYAKVHNSKYKLANGSTDYTATGKHRITVYATAEEGMQGASATIDVTVVQGIEELKVTVPSASIYKVNNKASSLKAAVTYNDKNGDVKTYVPKKKSVTWSIVKDKQGTAFNATEDKNNPIFKYVTIDKNGTIKVAKEYVVDPVEASNTFYVKATAADYAGNKVSNVSDAITITEKPQQIGEVVLAKKDNDSGKYEVLFRNKDTAVTAEDLKEAYLVVLGKGAPDDGFEERDTLKLNCFTLASSNKSAVAVDPADGKITINKVVGSVKLTATANDGSKQKSTLTLKLQYTKAAKNTLALKISGSYPYLSEADEKTDIFYDTDQKVESFEFDGTMGSILEVQVLKEDTESSSEEKKEWTDLTDFTDFKVTAKNAKLLTDPDNLQYNDKYKLVLTKKTATLTLTYTDGSNKKQTLTYNITNNGYTVPNSKAPTVSVKDKKDLALSLEAPQTLTVKIAPPNGVALGTFRGKQAKVEIDMSAANAKTLETYLNLDKSLIAGQADQIYTVDGNGEFTLTFTGLPNFSSIPAGTYKLKVTIGSWYYGNPRGTTFRPDYPAAALSLKAVATKTVKGSFKLATGYTLSLSDSWAELSTAGSKELKSFDIDTDTGLLNANVKGQDNDFTDYFEIVEIENNKYKIQLKLGSNDRLAEELADPKNAGKTLDQIIDSKDLTGYVQYTAAYGANPRVETNGTAKITITLKKDSKAGTNVSVRSYAATKAVTVLNDTQKVSADIEITTTVNKKAEPVDIAYAAAVDTTGEGKDDFTSIADDNPNYAANGSTVTLTSSKSGAETTTGKHPITLYVIPEDSALKDYIDNIEADEGAPDTGKTKAQKQLAAIITYGIKLSTAINVENAADWNKKLAVKTTKVTLNKDQYSKDGGYGNYWAEVGYSITGNCNIDTINVTNTAFADIKFDAVEDSEGSKLIRITVNKAGLKNINKAGKTITVPVDVTFTEAGVSTDKTYLKEPVKFSITLPKNVPDETQVSYAVIKGKIQSNTANIENAIVLPLPGEWAANSDERTAQYEEIVKAVYNKVNEEYIPLESDVLLVYPSDNIEDAYVATPEQDGTTGNLKVTLTLVDLTTVPNESGNDISKATEKANLDFNFTIPKKGSDPAVAKTTVEGWIGNIGSDKENITISNTTTAGEILGYLRGKLADDETLQDNLKLYIASYDDSVKASEEAPGEIVITIRIEDSLGYKDAATTQPKTIEIPQWIDITQTATKIEAALNNGAYEGTNKTTVAEVSKVVDGVINNPQIEWDWDWDREENDDGMPWTLTKAEVPTTEEPDAGVGHIVGVINLAYKANTGDHNPDSATANINIKISALLPESDVINAVAAAAIVEVEDGAAKEGSQSNAVYKFAIESANKADVRLKVLEVANAAIAAQPYTVRFKDPGRNEKFDFQAATWEAEGKISYTLEIVNDETNTALTVSDNKLVQEEYKLPARPELLTLNQAKSVVDAKLKSDGKDAWSAIGPDDTLETVKQKVEYKLNGYINSSKSNIYAVVTVTKYKASTVIDDLEVVFEWYLTEKGENPTKSKSASVTIKGGSSTDDTKIKNAVIEALAATKITLENAPAEGAITGKDKENAETVIKAAAGKALGNKYEVTVKELTESGEDKVTVNKAGTATIKLEVAISSTRTVGVDATCIINELTQTDDQAWDIVNDAVGKLSFASSEISLSEDAVAEKVKTALETALKDSLKKLYELEVEVTKIDSVSSPKKLEGTVTLKNTDKNNSVKEPISLEAITITD